MHACTVSGTEWDSARVDSACCCARKKALSPEYSTKSPNKLICRGSNEVVSRGVDVRVALSTPAGQRFTL